MSAHGDPDGLDRAIDDVARELTEATVDLRAGVASSIRRRSAVRWWIAVPAGAVVSAVIALLLTQRVVRPIDSVRDEAPPMMRRVEPLTIERLEVPALVVEPLVIEALNAG